MSVYKFLAWTSPGLQAALLEELKQLSFKPYANKISIYPSSAVFFDSSIQQLHHLLYKPSCITFLNLRISKPVPARNPREFLKQIKTLHLHPYIPVDAQLEVKLTIRRCYFSHSIAWKDAVLQALKDSQKERKLLSDGRKLLGLDQPAPQGSSPKLLVNAYLYQNHATLYIQLHHESLHKHGLKKALGKASLSENIATALLHFARIKERNHDYILWDPFCGSGTIPLCALVELMNLKIREGCFTSLTYLPIYRDHSHEFPEKELPLQIVASDKAPEQMKQFYKNLERLGLKSAPNKFPPHLMSKCYQNLDTVVMDYQGVYQNYLRTSGKKIVVVANPPWNKTLKFNHFEKMLKFFQGTADECYLLISNEQYQDVNKEHWKVLCEPLVGGKWTKIIYFKRGEIVKREEEKQIATLTFKRDISEYSNKKINSLQQQVEALSSKVNNEDYRRHLMKVFEKQAEKYGAMLSKLHIGTKTKVRQLMIKKREMLLKAKMRNLNLKLKQLQEKVKEEQIEMKKQEVKEKLMVGKYKLDTLSEDEREKLQDKLDKAAERKSKQLLKDERKRVATIPKW